MDMYINKGKLRLYKTDGHLIQVQCK